ncbi:N4-gp56 family major capsid protein [Novosphingobium subterraneum]|uniref:N4-gp56 family major capsid protein n=1 Tax=Novosphingobium subterraneum TaxID=48936 RepID=UPI003D07AFE4
MLNYNAPPGTKSDIDVGGNSSQMNTFFYLKKALITARKDQYFMQLAPTINMPKNFGKTIKVYEYIPMLDDRNINDMGLDAAGAVIANGNLYGSSRDIGTITGKLPTLTENGGRVNRVGFTRIQREGSLFKFGFFTEFTQEAMDFDSDEDLMDHLSRELMNGAVQLTEAVLQKDLLTAASVIVYAGAATSNATVTAEGAGAAIVSYANLMRLDQILTDNRTPKQTTVITGSRLVDTKTIAAARVMYVGSPLVPTLRAMKDLHNNPAFIPVQHYADAGNVLNGEIGTIDAFRIILVPEMLHWAGVGANVGTNPGYRATSGKYNVYPMLVVGDDSFATIGFQTDGKTVKFSVTTKMPGKETADRNDPYGETGFSSIKWYYGFLAKRPERIGMIRCVAPL